MATVPRGILEVKWKNSTSKEKQIKYRVRISRKNLKADEYFDTLEEAKRYLAGTKSDAGIAKIKEYDKEKKEQERLENDFLSSPPFYVYVNEYIKKHIEIKNDGTDLKQRNVKSDLSRLSIIMNTEVEFVNKTFQGLSFIVKSGLTHSRKKLRDFKLEEIDDVVITNYIRARLSAPKEIDFDRLYSVAINDAQRKEIVKQKALHKKKKIPALSTVKREVDTLSGIFTKIRFIDKNAYLTKMKGDNPCSTADISLLKGWNKQIKARIKPEVEEVIIKALKEFENREMLLIFALAMTTGMRRSELLSLKWSQINFSENKIDLSRTKNGNSREVVLNDDAKEVIRAIPKKDDNLFHYTIDGYNSNWQKIKKRSGFKQVRMHDTRREFISKMLQMCQSTIVVADMIGMSDIKHFENHYVEPVRTLSTQAGVMSTVGHETKSVTKGYFTK